MGEVAEMMLDGTLCAGCGVYLDNDSPGYPCYCRDCAKDQREAKKQGNIARHEQYIAANRKTKCATCGKRVKEVGLKDHMRDAHGATS